MKADNDRSLALIFYWRKKAFSLITWVVLWLYYSAQLSSMIQTSQRQSGKIVLNCLLDIMQESRRIVDRIQKEICKQTKPDIAGINSKGRLLEDEES